MRGVILVTDHEWFEFLSRQPELDEVNFWRPSDTETPRFPAGTPVLFKLKKRYGGFVVGFGVFHSHVVLPAWRAWTVFEERNGAPDFEAMRRRIERLRRSAAGEEVSAGGYPIGCLLLSKPVFLRRDDWVAPPADWHDNIVQGKGYDLAAGEGARVWQEVSLRAAAYPVGRELLDLHREEAPRYGEAVLVRPRLGQGTFRLAVTDAYRGACAITTEHSLPVLEAAHIRPFSGGGPHEVSNGLLLRTDIHRLFDTGYVTVTPDYRFLVSRRLRDEFENGRTYYDMQGRTIHLPADPRDYPDPAKLEWHAREVFRESA